MDRRLFRMALVPFDPPDLMQQSNNPARQPLGVCDAVTAQPFAQVARFADIQNSFVRAAHQINAGASRQRVKEILAQSLHERLGRVEQPELTSSHAPISTRVDWDVERLVFHCATPAPTASTIPMTSWPGTPGYCRPGQ